MSSDQSQAAFAAPQEYCDIVMKGGITSGVVYPLALTSLAKKYRFSNIGGTSAGAIAVAAAAAAEYGRLSDKGGFLRLSTVPDEVGPHLKSLFQPTPALKPLFDIFVAVLESRSALGKIAGVLRAAFLGYRKEAFIGGSLGSLLALLLIAQGVAFWPSLVLFILLLTLGVAVAARLASDRGVQARPARQRLRPMPRPATRRRRRRRFYGLAHSADRRSGRPRARLGAADIRRAQEASGRRASDHADDDDDESDGEASLYAAAR